MFGISVVHGDILDHRCDLLVLKHADGFFGVDKRVADAIGFESSVPSGLVFSTPGGVTKAKRVAFIGVGPLVEFSYKKIREFGKQAVAIAEQQQGKLICMPIHGPGYGLDEAEAFSSLVAGIFDAVERGGVVQTVDIVEINASRAKRFSAILSTLLPSAWNTRVGNVNENSLSKIQHDLRTFGFGSEQKPRLFVAMPFKDEFNDEWEISIQESVNSLEMLCERIDKSAFVGDISAEIRRRIEQYDGLIALLNGANPNVFLEIGYAWAKNKPTVLLAKDGQDLPFDVKGQRCIFYKGIADLRTKLRSELGQLQSDGVLRRV